MTSPLPDRWHPGARVAVRGREWTILGVSRGLDCAALRLTAHESRDTSLTLLTPFDRPRAIEPRHTPRVVRRRRWAHEVCRRLLDIHSFGSLRATASTTIRLVPYQLEPALAVLGHGATRLLIADGVGLGKTVEAGIILLELRAQYEAFRALVLSPAGLREQWATELRSHFGLTAMQADASWLHTCAREWPPDVNPWSLPGIYLASHDFVKRPEVLRPLEEVIWDLLVVDEAHAAAPGTDRRAAIHAVATRARRVVLLTATPPTGEPDAYRALCEVGALPGSRAAITIFRRTREEVGGHSPRRTVALLVRPSDGERRMHHVLERYTRIVWTEAGARGDQPARLASIVLRKRALSSAASLLASVRRRMALLDGGPTTGPVQLPLPSLFEEDPLEDAEPSAALGAPGLTDARRERRWLEAIRTAAETAAMSETKCTRLIRFLKRIREPAIVFTEYRDTLARLEQAITQSGLSVVTLHGGMTPSDRSRVQRLFNEGTALLLATDAASEGLNLHHRCRVVVHYELPWSLSRLEQRAGRVDRMGQTKRVHEVALVSGNTAERFVLAPLAARAARMRATDRTSQGLVQALTESRVADIVMSGQEVPEIPAPRCPSGEEEGVALDLKAEAVREVGRLIERRGWQTRSSGPRTSTAPTGPVVSSTRVSRTALPQGLLLVYRVALVTSNGVHVHADLVVLHIPGSFPRSAARRGIVDLVERHRLALSAPISAALDTAVARAHALVLTRHQRQVEALSNRERSLMQLLASAARQIVQAGLFDQRALRQAARRERVRHALLDDLDQAGRECSRTTSVSSEVEFLAALVVTR